MLGHILPYSRSPPNLRCHPIKLMRICLKSPVFLVLVNQEVSQMSHAFLHPKDDNELHFFCVLTSSSVFDTCSKASFLLGIQDICGRREWQHSKMHHRQFSFT